MRQMLRAVIALGVVFVAIPSLAQVTAKAGGTQAAVVQVGISKGEAETLALKLVPGKVLEIEREKHAGEAAFSIEIRAADGVHEVIVRVADGTVLANKERGDKKEDEDGDNDKGDED